MSDDFDYGRAEADLYDSDCIDSEEIYEYKTERGRNEFLRENGLNPDNYRNNGGGGSGSGNSDPCYLTTACVVARNLPDNCEELMVLRKFRDTYLANRKGGADDIKHYYNVAPRIVDAINSRVNSTEIWHNLYNMLVKPCVALISAGSFEEAYSLYRSKTEELEKDYL